MRSATKLVLSPELVPVAGGGACFRCSGAVDPLIDAVLAVGIVVAQPGPGLQHVI